MDTKLLKAKMVLAGKTVKTLCEETGMAESTFYKKLRGVTEFTKPEIEMIAKSTKMTPDEMLKIFFGNMVA